MLSWCSEVRRRPAVAVTVVTQFVMQSAPVLNVGTASESYLPQDRPWSFAGREVNEGH